MDGVVRNRVRINRDAGNNYGPAVIRELELVISNQSELEQSAEILLQGKDLPKSSLISECLTGRFFAEPARRRTRGFSLPVDLPLGQ